MKEITKTEKLEKCGFQIIKLGRKLQAAEDAENPETTFEIIELGLKDSDGFEAIKIKFSDGEEEITAIDNLLYGINHRGLRII